MTDTSWTWDRIIDALGGTAAVTEGLNLSSPSIPSGWRTRGIPGHRFADVAALARARGKPEITLSVLADLAARRLEARA